MSTCFKDKHTATCMAQPFRTLLNYALRAFSFVETNTFYLFENTDQFNGFMFSLVFNLTISSMKYSEVVFLASTEARLFYI
jgi:hypothetical protein